MKFCILLGSPRKNGNTMSLIRPFMSELDRHRARTELVTLYGKKIEGCTACRTCQKDWTKFGCRFNDDLQPIFDSILASDAIILATPIYSWFCTAPMKAALDRLVYGMNKYYGDEKGPALWSGKSMGIIATCGYRPENGADLFEEGIKRYCKHSQLRYLSMLAERDPGYKSVFMSEDKEERARGFARNMLSGLTAN